MMPPTAEIDRAMLRQSMLDAGLARGDAVIVHASMKSLGRVRGGPTAVIAALQDVVGPRGTLLMPTFCVPQPDGQFHVAGTPSRTGLLTETFRTSSGVIRSWHPTHSVTAWGAQAEAWTAGHHRLGGLGAGSPMHRAAEAGARVLMIGCDLRRCSLIHVAEAVVRVPYLGKVWYGGSDRTLRVITPAGEGIEVPPIDPPTCSAAFDRVEPPLEAGGGLERVRIAAAECLLFRGSDALAAAVALLRRDAGALLCDDAKCSVCPRARALLA